jgi:hypothetical protein
MKLGLRNPYCNKFYLVVFNPFMGLQPIRAKMIQVSSVALGPLFLVLFENFYSRGDAIYF